MSILIELLIACMLVGGTLVAMGLLTAGIGVLRGTVKPDPRPPKPIAVDKRTNSWV